MLQHNVCTRELNTTKVRHGTMVAVPSANVKMLLLDYTDVQAGNTTNYKISFFLKNSTNVLFLTRSSQLQHNTCTLGIPKFHIFEKSSNFHEHC